MTTYLFPGQGSQKVGMGGNLFEEYMEITERASAILGYSIKELCLYDSKNRLNFTQYTQPALYVVNALSYLERIRKDGKKPDFVVGHSMGEYSALFAAGAFDFDTGLRLVQRRGNLMGQVHGGGMAAIIGLIGADIVSLLEKNGLQEIDIANYNSPKQTVISGPKELIEKSVSIFKSAGAQLCIPLAVSGAFHSRYMEPLRKEFALDLNLYKFNDLDIPVISNVEARPYTKEKICYLLEKQITHPVRWIETIQYLMGKGEHEFIEAGPGNVLTGLTKKICEESPCIIVPKDPVEQHELPKKEETFLVGMKIKAESLGSEFFRKDYNLKYSYYAGSMHMGIASKEMVVKLGEAGLMGFLGTGGMDLEWIEKAIKYIQFHLKDGQSYGMNLLCNLMHPEIEEKAVSLYLKYGIRIIEAAGFIDITPSLVWYRLKGIHRNKAGQIEIPHHIIAKVSRPEVAQKFMSPAPEARIQKLVETGALTKEEAELGRSIPLAGDICVEADSGGHTDRRSAYALMPAMIALRNEMMDKHGYKKSIRVGAAGGIGAPQAAAAAFIMGADFIVTGSINQCTVEAGTSDAVKDILQGINVQDTTYAHAGDMFEMGAQAQVVRKGLFFPAYANKLYDLYRHYNSLDEIDKDIKKQLEEKYFKKNFDSVWQEIKEYYAKINPKEIERANQNPKHKMALIFKWYFVLSSQLAINGSDQQMVDYQIYCGPALGAFNQWVKGTELENWRNRKVALIAEKLMTETAALLQSKFQEFIGIIHK